jgi:hypothetical protein
VECGPPADIPSFYGFSLHKAGSTLLYTLLKHFCNTLQIPIFEPETEEYNHGLELGSLDESVLEILCQRGYCFSGFRLFPEYLKGVDLRSHKKIFLIRDPRDMLVSHYFSQKFSHEIPPGDLGGLLQSRRDLLALQSIDEYAVENASELRINFEAYENNIYDGQMKLFRYEDVIFAKEQWLNDILDYLDLSLPSKHVRQIANLVDHRPVIENPMNHIRRVTPGDHKEKLHPATIEYLNEFFRDILVRYNYWTDADDEGKVFRRNSAARISA